MRQKRLFMFIAVCYFVSSASIMLLGMGDISGKTASPQVAIISVLIFWLLPISAITAQLVLRKPQKNFKNKLLFLLVFCFELTILTMGNSTRKTVKLFF